MCESCDYGSCASHSAVGRSDATVSVLHLGLKWIYPFFGALWHCSIQTFFFRDALKQERFPNWKIILHELFCFWKLCTKNRINVRSLGKCWFFCTIFWLYEPWALWVGRNVSEVWLGRSQAKAAFYFLYTWTFFSECDILSIFVYMHLWLVFCIV